MMTTSITAAPESVPEAECVAMSMVCFVAQMKAKSKATRVTPLSMLMSDCRRTCHKICPNHRRIAIARTRITSYIRTLCVESA